MCTLLVCKFTKNLANSEKINEKNLGKIGKIGRAENTGNFWGELGELGTLRTLGKLRTLGRQGTPLTIFINSLIVFDAFTKRSD